MFQKMYPILMLNSARPRALNMSLCLIFLRIPEPVSLFDTSHDDFGCLKAELRQFF